jgi:hypothetical protein
MTKNIVEEAVLISDMVHAGITDFQDKNTTPLQASMNVVEAGLDEYSKLIAGLRSRFHTIIVMYLTSQESTQNTVTVYPCITMTYCKEFVEYIRNHVDCQDIDSATIDQVTKLMPSHISTTVVPEDYYPDGVIDTVYTEGTKYIPTKGRRVQRLSDVVMVHGYMGEQGVLHTTSSNMIKEVYDQYITWLDTSEGQLRRSVVLANVSHVLKDHNVTIESLNRSMSNAV